jgi:hypothetical protein
MGYLSVPVVLRAGSFRIVIYLPPREHGPPHVHVDADDGEIVVELARGVEPARIRRVRGLSTSDAMAGFRVVESNLEFLRTCWRKYHG